MADIDMADLDELADFVATRMTIDEATANLVAELQARGATWQQAARFSPRSVKFIPFIDRKGTFLFICKACGCSGSMKRKGHQCGRSALKAWGYMLTEKGGWKAGLRSLDRRGWKPALDTLKDAQPVFHDVDKAIAPAPEEPAVAKKPSMLTETGPRWDKELGKGGPCSRRDPWRTKDNMTKATKITGYFNTDCSEPPGARYVPSVTQGIPSGTTMPGLYFQLLHILNMMQNEKCAWPFQHSVNEQEVPGYYDIIKEPMDLWTMGLKIGRGDYPDPRDFIKDAQLIFDNCRTFYEKSSIHAKAASHLEAFMWDNIKDVSKWPEIDPADYGVDLVVHLSRQHLIETEKVARKTRAQDFKDQSTDKHKDLEAIKVQRKIEKRKRRNEKRAALREGNSNRQSKNQSTAILTIAAAPARSTQRALPDFAEFQKDFISLSLA